MNAEIAVGYLSLEIGFALLGLVAVVPLHALTVPAEPFTAVDTRKHLPIPLRPLLVEALLDAAIAAALVVSSSLLLAPEAWYALAALAALLPLGGTLAMFGGLPSAAPARWFVPYAFFGGPALAGVIAMNLRLWDGLRLVPLASPVAAALTAAALTLVVAVSVRPLRILWTAARPPDPGLASTAHLR